MNRDPALANKYADERTDNGLGRRISRYGRREAIARGVALGDDAPFVHDDDRLGAAIRRALGFGKGAVEGGAQGQIRGFDDSRPGDLR